MSNSNIRWQQTQSSQLHTNKTQLHTNKQFTARHPVRRVQPERPGAQRYRAPIDRAPYVSLPGPLLDVKMEAHTFLSAPSGACSAALNFFRWAVSSLPFGTCNSMWCVWLREKEAGHDTKAAWCEVHATEARWHA